MRTYEQLQKVMQTKGYKWFVKNLSLNFIWERTNNKFSDIFDDFFYVAYIDGEDKKVIQCMATTKAGLYSAQNPNTIDGIQGVAVIQPGQYLNAWEFMYGDKLTNFLKVNNIIKYPWTYPHFRQIGLLNYYRDGDKDVNLEAFNEQFNKMFYTQWHNMSRLGTYGSGLVQNWSAGCMGWPEPETKKFLPIVMKSIRIYGDKVSGTLLETSDFTEKREP